MCCTIIRKPGSLEFWPGLQISRLVDNFNADNQDFTDYTTAGLSHEMRRVYFEVETTWNSGDLEEMFLTYISPVFIDFEASSLSPASWPIEVGLAWLEGKGVVVESRLIRPRIEWPEDDWNPESEAVHNIPRSNLDDAESADNVTVWLLKTVGGKELVSDAPEFDQRWLDRLLGKPGPKIRDFDSVVWEAFSDGGNVRLGRLHRVYNIRTKRQTTHRAGADAADLCYAWRAGVGV